MKTYSWEKKRESLKYIYITYLLSNDVIYETHIADIADIAEIADIAHIWQSPLSVSYVSFSLSAAHQGQ